ncbi:MAG: ACP S-malonyltransferase [Alphaproteobacteria bacterium]|nr:ACP S-malonyltransferase [Alphaproteobacteria bacterium]
MLFMFPGQGSQKIGMGRDIYDAFQTARDVFHEVDEAISFKLSDLIFNGTEEELKATENAQPALMTVSMAFAECLKKEYGFNLSEKAKFFAGHSLGEYTALCAAGVLSLSDTAKILRIRGKAMAEACPSGGAMAAIIGLPYETVEEIVNEASSAEAIVKIANDNSVGQVVVSGHENAVKLAVEKATAAKAKMAVMLEVSGPFHSPLMEKAVKPLAEALSNIKFFEPVKPIIANVTAKDETSNFKELLVKQITNRVRWRESILFAESAGVSKCVEIGSGRVLTGLVKRTASNLALVNIHSTESLESFAKENA